MRAHLGKMLFEGNDSLDYHLKLDNACLYLNPYIVSKITLTWTATINCGNETPKSYNQKLPPLPKENYCLTPVRIELRPLSL